MDSEFIAYREVASAIEDEYYQLEAEDKSRDVRIAYLVKKLDCSEDIFHRVCILRLLCQELAVLEMIEKRISVVGGSAEDRFNDLYRIARFDPLSVIDCASYHLYDRGDIERAMSVGLYAAFISEHAGAYIRLSHQLLLRIAHSKRDLGTAEVAVRRILEYHPDLDSPDPAIESDVIRMVAELDLDPILKSAFFDRLR